MRAQIGLLGGTGTLARSVMFATASPVSHIVLGVGEGLVISAQLGGTVLRSIDSFRIPNRTGPKSTRMLNPIIWSRYDLTPTQEDDIVDFGYSHLGAPYNLLEAGAILLSRALTIKYPQRAYAYYHCAQLGYDAYRAAGIDPLPGKRPGPVHPGHFHQHWAHHHWYDLGVANPTPPE